MPVFGICRGFQEMNVAFGGTLHQKLHEVPGNLDHREDESQPLEVQYGPAHEVTLEPGGAAARGWPARDRIRVNSLHCQGIERLGHGLAVEARAPDGVIEAFRVRAARALRARGAVAPGVAGDEQPVFARAVRRLRAASRERAAVKMKGCRHGE